MSSAKKKSTRARGLPKLKLKVKQKESVFDDHTIQVLLRNGLEIKNKSNKLSLMQAVSEALFLSSSHAQNLIRQCSKYVRSNLKRKKVPKKLKFLRREKDFIDDYLQNPEDETFEAVSSWGHLRFQIFEKSRKS